MSNVTAQLKNDIRSCVGTYEDEPGEFAKIQQAYEELLSIHFDGSYTYERTVAAQFYTINSMFTDMHDPHYIFITKDIELNILANEGGAIPLWGERYIPADSNLNGSYLKIKEGEGGLLRITISTEALNRFISNNSQNLMRGRKTLIDIIEGFREIGFNEDFTFRQCIGCALSWRFVGEQELVKKLS